VKEIYIYDFVDGEINHELFAREEELERSGLKHDRRRQWQCPGHWLREESECSVPVAIIRNRFLIEPAVSFPGETVIFQPSIFAVGLLVRVRTRVQGRPLVVHAK
jgi:hypothetical protein